MSAAARVNAAQWQSLQSQISFLATAAQSAGKSLEQIIKLSRQTDQQRQMENDEHHLQLRAAAHEINNPLSIINNYLYLLSQKLDDDPEAAAQLNIIQEEMGAGRNHGLRSETSDEYG